jgi:predicted metal-dependent peptidase
MIDPYKSPMEAVRAETRTPADLTPAEWDAVDERLRCAVMSLVFHFPLMGFYLYELAANVAWVRQETVINGNPFRTLATDGKHLFAWPFFVLHCPPAQLIGYCLHEAVHCVFLHLGRKAGRDAARWNIAADYVTNMLVNDLARERNGVPIPKDGVFTVDTYKRMNSWLIPVDDFYYDERFRDPASKESLAAEQIYELLKTHPKGRDKSFDPHDLTGMPGAEVPDPRHIIERLRAAHARVTAQGIGAGLGGGALERRLNEWLYPPLRWQQFLLRWMTPAPGRWAYAPGDLRHEDSMPARRKLKRVEYLPVILDTSGSMTDEEIAAAISECRAIIRQFPGIEGILIECDAAVQFVGKLADPYPIIRGGGGTIMTPAFAHLEKEGLIEKTKVALVFTDGYLGAWDQEYTKKLGIDVLWVLTNHQIPVPKAPNFYATRLRGIADSLAA